MSFKIKRRLFLILLAPSLDFCPFSSAFICTVMPPWIKLDLSELETHDNLLY